MLHVIERRPPEVHCPLMGAMFEARHRVFVDLLHWDLPVTDGRFEIDAFDTRHAVYLIVTDGRGAHLASARLLPTTRPHILGSLYAGLCEDGVPTGAGTWEVTRFCLERRIPAALRRAARDSLVMGLAEIALARGIDRYTGVAELGWLQQILAFGWICRPLGMPTHVEGMMLGALEIDINRGTLAALAANGIRASHVPLAEARHAA